MTEYRIKKTYDFYYVEKKGLFFWKCAVHSYSDISSHKWPKSFVTYLDAKKELERLIERDAKWAKIDKERKAFKNRYYYPPLPDEEPE